MSEDINELGKAQKNKLDIKEVLNEEKSFRKGHSTLLFIGFAV